MTESSPIVSLPGVLATIDLEALVVFDETDGAIIGEATMDRALGELPSISPFDHGTALLSEVGIGRLAVG